MFHITPERNEQLARQRNDPDTSHSTTAVSKPALIPGCEAAVGLIPHPTPCELHHQTAHVFVPGARVALVVRALAALIWGGNQAHQATELSSVLNLAPPKDLGSQGPRADGADPPKRGQALDVAADRRLRIRHERGALRIQFVE